MARWSGNHSHKLFETLLEKLNGQQWDLEARDWDFRSVALRPLRLWSDNAQAQGINADSDNGWRDWWSGRRLFLEFGSNGTSGAPAASSAARIASPATAQADSNAGDADRPGSLRLTSSSADGFVSGATVTAAVRDRDGVDTVAYQWRVRENGQWHDISGADGPTLTLDDDIAGHRLRVIATYVDGRGHESTVARSFNVKAAPAPEPRAAPEPPAAPPASEPPPPLPLPPSPPQPANSPGILTVSPASRLVEGATVTANVTDADSPGPISYQWQKRAPNGAWQNISGATGKTYTIGFADGGSELRVLANYTDGAGHGEALQFAFKPADVDRPGDVSVTSSSAQGFVVGATVTAQLSDPDGVGAVSYQWASKSANGPWQDIAGAAGQSYTLTAQDAGKEIHVTAQYVDLQGHNSTVVEPFVVAAVSAPPPSSPPPASPPPASPPAPEPPPSSGPGEPDLLLGVNLAGAEFGNARPGTYGVDYIYPNHAEIDYYAGKGVEVIRLPFLWERVQPTKNGPLSAAELARMDDVVDYAASKGIMVVLDVHNYGSAYGALIGSSGLPNSSFADFWGKLAAHFKNDPNVMFGLMNEPHQQSASQWIQSVNAAIDAIRDAGATQKILVPGTYWDGAWTWVSSDNDTVIGNGVVDPLNNYAFEVHQYLDSDGSGTSSSVVSSNVGVQRLTAVTEWAQATGNQLFLGEFGVAQNPTSLQALDNMLNYMHQHQDVWLGATYWAGGPWWGNYMFSIEVANGVDKPQMDVLERYL